ncbi:major facilitator superfamily domain-containing protein [Kockovaella imperatae]|uniref:Major facilitator superfamily domain-containing protein n=1 Tax=Kockovaella imperatae TaxID=4999 RepID=A0A1Y1UAV1_9TREE|nr:major facilitator superfamily domain-containing protein [Kockovaella imperatae]ORX35168.1 major facilitator superfamily domain-containing protein [Kockovaella imperatae]
MSSSSPLSCRQVEAQDSSEALKLAHGQGIKPAVMAKVQVLNEAIKEIGMGRFQYELFFTAGFGWFADNIWLQGISILNPSIGNEFRGQPGVGNISLALYAGLILGATFWGCSCDIVGRKIAWNCTLVIGGIFGIAAGAAPNFIALCALIAMIGFGVGGNLPVDGTLFLEFIPGSHQYLLTLLSVWWAIGQVVGSLIAWAFLAKYGCDTPPAGEFCSRSSNSGWRYTFYTLGAMMIVLWVGRFFLLPVYESPKFLASIGRDQEAVDTIHLIAKRNGKVSSLTLDDLRSAAEPYLDPEHQHRYEETKSAPGTKMSSWQLFRHSFDDLSFDHVKALFCTPRLAWSTSLVIFIYASIGLAYPLFNQFLGAYLSAKNANLGEDSLDSTYSAFTYQAACGVPGSILAAILVEWGRGGRKVAMAFFTVAAGIFLFGLTQAKTKAQINVLTCFAALCENAFYGVLYGYAPEVFPTPSRGTGDALAAASNRITGLFAPVIAVYGTASVEGPVYASASIFVVTGLVMLLLPIETRGRTAL